MLTPTEIARLLGRYLPSPEAERRAAAIHADLIAVGFDLVASHEVSDAEWLARGARPQAEYILPPTPFHVDASDCNQAMDGSGLTRGNLLRLSHAVDLGRKWLPQSWPMDFAADLRGAGHLDALSELWWLKRWRGLATVERGPKLYRDGPDADWRLEVRVALTSCVVNLEVKRRTANLNAWFKHGKATIPLRDVSRKFQASDRDTANVVALTVFHRPAADGLARVRDWLAQQPAVDAVLIWVEANLGGEPLLVFVKPEKPWIPFLLHPADPEDLMVAGLTRGTLCQPREVPAFMRKHVGASRLAGQ